MKHLRGYNLVALDVRKVDKKTRSIEVIASTDAEDGHGTIIQQDWQLTRYLNNPIVYFEHNQAVGDGFFTSGGERPADKIPIAHAENVRVEENKLRAKFVFPAEGRDELADKVWLAIEDKRLNGVSVGFLPGKVEREEVPGGNGRSRYRLSQCVLFEISIVGVPSNPECVVERSMLERFIHNPSLLELPPERIERTSVPTTARSASTEFSMDKFLQILAKKLGCTADEVSIIEALDKAQAQRSIGAELITGEADNVAKDLRTQVETLTKDLDASRTIVGGLKLRAVIALAAVTALGLADTAGEAEVTKSIAGLQGRAAKADELEPKVKALDEDLAKRDAAEASREVEFLIKRGKDYELSYDERSRKALLAYRKADPKGFAEDHKAALDGLRAFDDPKLFEKVTAPGGEGSATVDTTATRGATNAEADEFDARVIAYRKKNADATESEAIDAVLRNRDRA